jgi:hypothetical protein
MKYQYPCSTLKMDNLLTLKRHDDRVLVWSVPRDDSVSEGLW